MRNIHLAQLFGLVLAVLHVVHCAIFICSQKFLGLHRRRRRRPFRHLHFGSNGNFEFEFGFFSASVFGTATDSLSIAKWSLNHEYLIVFITWGWLKLVWTWFKQFFLACLTCACRGHSCCCCCCYICCSCSLVGLCSRNGLVMVSTFRWIH